MKLFVTCVLAVCLMCAESKKERGGGKKKLIAKLTERLEDLEAEVATLKAVPKAKPASNLVVVSSEEGAGDENCARICSGITGCDWIHYNYFNSNPGAFASVDMRACGFVKIPTITVSLGGTTWHWKAIGSNAIYSATSTSFSVYLSTEVVGDKTKTESFAKEQEWNIQWMAVGYTC